MSRPFGFRFPPQYAVQAFMRIDVDKYLLDNNSCVNSIWVMSRAFGVRFPPQYAVQAFMTIDVDKYILDNNSCVNVT